MRFRKLQIAWSVGCAIACVLLTYGFIRHERSVDDAPYVEVYASWNSYSYLILPAAILAIAPWPRWLSRFSLRTLLIATTLFTAVLGLIVAVL
jgi:hypothetical protein